MPRLYLATAGLVALAVIAAGTSAAPSAPAPAAPTRLRYNRDIRPILSDNCFYCHGPDKNHRKGKFRLDDRDSAVAKKAIDPDKLAESTILERIISDDEDEVMPPPETHKVLSVAQKQTLKRWIEQGAAYEPYWAYVPPVRVPTPEVKPAAWVRNPIDAFILQTLESRGIAPSPEADRRTLLRRVSLDLIGLPPTPEEMAAFLSDTRPDAYDRQVERLLGSPHFGERMAVPWLDAVRFADTVGFHGDQNIDVFPYRDYVINAFNANKPFDQFTVEQLAGDLLPNPTPEQLVATGYNRLNMVTREGGAQSKEYLAKYAADRVRTLSGAFLGSTMGCCECHDHKFDPFTSKDFYSMEAFWADVKQWGIYSSYGYTPNPDLKGWTNDHPFPPEIVVDSPYLQRRGGRFSTARDQVIAVAAAKLRQNPAQLAAFEQWERKTAEFLETIPSGWSVAQPVGVVSADVPKAGMAAEKKKAVKLTATKAVATKPAATTPVATKQAATATAATQEFTAKLATTKPGEERTSGPIGPTRPGSVASSQPVQLTYVIHTDGRILLLGKTVKTDKIECMLHAGTIAAIRVEALPSDKHGGTILRALMETAAPQISLSSALVQITGSIKPKAGGKAVVLAIADADAEIKDPRYSNGSAIIGTQSGWLTSSNHAKLAQAGVWVLDRPVKVAEGDLLEITLPKNALGEVRISVSPIAPPEPADPKFIASVANALKAKTDDDALIQQTYLLSSAWDAQALGDFRRLRQEIRACRGGKSPEVVTVATTQPAVVRILARGNWQDETGAIVQPNVPHFLPQPEVAATRRLTRLDLARWLVSDKNPLTSRAVINRMWKQFYGNGICNSVEDLGAQGEWPSHPELLDWLAVEFRESGWDVKHMVRLMVESNTYRQSSNLRPELHDIDPNNRLLASQNPRRLEAEFVRDNALSIAGLLNLDIGGPSAFPYQPPGYYVNIQFPSRDWISDTDDREYRRGIYMHWQRTFLHPMLANFDAPSREDGVCTRNVSNTPQQALTLLNDPEFVEAARALAQAAVGTSMADEQRIEFVYQRALGRDPEPRETQSLGEFLAQQRDIYKTSPADAAKLVHEGYAPVPANVDVADLAAWTNVCRVVLNLHETITRY